MFSPRLLVPIVVCSASLALSAGFAAETKPKVSTNTAEAGPDFNIQGEYVGEGCAAQVIALGEGKFRIVGWRVGLPGSTAEAEKVVEIDAKTDDDKVAFEGGGWRGQIADGMLTGSNNDGVQWTLRKMDRKSPSLGSKPPEGAVILFDGTKADAWEGGKVTAEGTLQCGTKSKQSFGDCTLHIEFRTPFKPEGRGQDRGNSGVYLQDRYEVQVLDSFGLKGENNECGGIYTVAKPKINMCLPPLAWQTYDIDFESAKFDSNGTKTKNAVMTVRHNGVLIHDHVEIPKATTAAGRPEGAAPGPIQLQNHGNPVVYRNIWLVERK